jgi:hypothetical protein
MAPALLPGEVLQQIESHYRDGDMGPALEYAPDRSPGTKLDQLNATGPAIMFAHASTTHQFGVYLGLFMFALAGDAREKPLPTIGPTGQG